MAPPVGARASCQACGGEIVRVAVEAPFPHADWLHRGAIVCPGPRAGTEPRKPREAAS